MIRIAVPSTMDIEEEDFPPSKSQRKREMLALQDMGKELVALSAGKLEELNLPDLLRDAIQEARRITSFGALRRQMQYIGKLMCDVDPAPIQARLDAWNGVSDEETARLHRIERWRTRLLEDDQALSELLVAHPQADAQRLRTLIRNVKRESEAKKPPKSFRELFQELRDILNLRDDN